MLVLTRRVGEVLLIGDGRGNERAVRVMIVAVRSGNAVKVGIEAPQGVSVHREEVLVEIERERMAAGAATTGGG